LVQFDREERRSIGLAGEIICKSESGNSTLNNNPDFENLRSEPRFPGHYKKLGLSDYQNPE